MYVDRTVARRRYFIAVLPGLGQPRGDLSSGTIDMLVGRGFHCNCKQPLRKCLGEDPQCGLRRDKMPRRGKL